MAGRRAPPRRATALVQTPKVGHTQTQRAFDVLTAAVQQLQTRRAAAAVSVAGSRAGGDALENLLAVLAELGIIKDDTEA